MATVTMDSSEYELMKENKSLLEKALEENKKQQEQINLLKEEKIKVLEESKMKVVKVLKKSVYSSYYALKSEGEIRDNLFHYFRKGLTEYGSGSMNSLIEALFYPVTNETDEVESVSLHGLGEIKEEITKELKDNLAKDVKEKLKAYDKFKETLEAKNKDIKEFTKSIYSAKNEILKLEEEVKVLKEENENLKKNNEILRSIKSLLLQHSSWFKQGELIRKIKDLLKQS